MSAAGALRAFTKFHKNLRILLRVDSSICRNFARLYSATLVINRNVSHLPLLHRKLSTLNSNPSEATDSVLDGVSYERVCSETLDALSDYFEELIENATNLTNSDVTHSDGVLTVNLGKAHGIYVINRQTPNKQIWLSSPYSGPKRYDFMGAKDGSEGRWIYKHNGESLHELLQREVQPILKEQQVDFLHLPFGS